jgi:hypothetical protein
MKYVRTMLHGRKNIKLRISVLLRAEAFEEPLLPSQYMSGKSNFASETG